MNTTYDVIDLSDQMSDNNLAEASLDYVINKLYSYYENQDIKNKESYELLEDLIEYVERLKDTVGD